jgi:Protein of unknown function (DUF433)
MPVASILAYLSGGMSIDEMLTNWPELERENIYQALGFAATLMEEKVVLLSVGEFPAHEDKPRKHYEPNLESGEWPVRASVLAALTPRPGHACPISSGSDSLGRSTDARFSRAGLMPKSPSSSSA